MLQPRSPTVPQCQVSSLLQSETILFISSTPTSPTIEDKDTPFSTRLVPNTPPSHGEQVELYLVSQESLDLVLPEQDKLPSVTCAEKLECSLHLKSGEDGTERSMSPKEDMLLPLPSPHLPLPLLLWLEVTSSKTCQSSHSSSTVSETVPPNPFSPPSTHSVSPMIFPRLENPDTPEPVKVN